MTRVSHQKIRPQRANLAVHHKLLHELVQRQAVLPCAFGTVATSEEQLLEVLRTNCDELLRQLAVLRGKVEMSLGVYWNTSNIFEFFVANNQELKEMRDRVFRPGREPSMDERLELGRLFESLLQQCRERHTQQVIDTLSPYCAEIRAVDPGAEQMIMKLVCLVHKDQQQVSRRVSKRRRESSTTTTPSSTVGRGHHSILWTSASICLRRTRMFLLDDILLAPMKGLAAVCRKVEEAARQDLENQEKGAMSALGELHRRLEMGQIDEKDFDLEEARLLDQIEGLEKVLHPHD